MRFRKCTICGEDVQLGELGEFCLGCNAKMFKDSIDLRYSGGKYEICEGMHFSVEEEALLEKLHSDKVERIVFKRCVFDMRSEDTSDQVWIKLFKETVFDKCVFFSAHVSCSEGGAALFCACSFNGGASLRSGSALRAPGPEWFESECPYPSMIFDECAFDNLVLFDISGEDSGFWLCDCGIDGRFRHRAELAGSRLAASLLRVAGSTSFEFSPSATYRSFRHHGRSLRNIGATVVTLSRCTFESSFDIQIEETPQMVKSEESRTIESGELRHPFSCLSACSTFCGPVSATLEGFRLVDFAGSSFCERALFDLNSALTQKSDDLRCYMFDDIVALGFIEFRGADRCSILSFDGVDLTDCNLVNLALPRLQDAALHGGGGAGEACGARGSRSRRGLSCSSEVYSSASREADRGHPMFDILRYSAEVCDSDPKKLERHLLACRSLARNYEKSQGAYPSRDLYYQEVEAQTACLKHESGNRFNLLLWRLYGVVSGYGEDAFRPLVVLLAMLAVFWACYALFLSNFASDSQFDPAILLQALTISVGATFLRGAQVSQDIANHDAVLLLSYLQATLSAIVIALLVLAARRRFSKK